MEPLLYPGYAAACGYAVWRSCFIYYLQVCFWRSIGIVVIHRSFTCTAFQEGLKLFARISIPLPYLLLCWRIWTEPLSLSRCGYAAVQT